MHRNIMSAIGITAIAGLAAGCSYHKVAYEPTSPPAVTETTAVSPPTGVETVPGPTVAVSVPTPPPTAIGLVAPSEPPDRLAEAIPDSPSGSYVWTPGYWYWDSQRWVWTGGCWVKRPFPHAEWVPPHYKHAEGGYVWVSGYWTT